MSRDIRNRGSYVPLRTEEEEDPRFIIPPEEVPYGSIALAVFLMLFGMASFVLAWLHFTQAIFGKEQAEVGFTVVGLLTFIPGFYHTRIAYYAWKGTPGYRWSDIPSY
eukprot:jgi/Chrzof1/4829/Cz15g00260.t1